MVISRDQCYYLGYISKTQGFKGRLIIFLDVDTSENYIDLKRVLIDLKGVLTPFFIEDLVLKEKSFAQVKLEGVDDRDAAAAISNHDLYLPLSDLPALRESEYYLFELEGMQVEDQNKNVIGKIDSVLDYNQNTLLQIQKDGKEILIPLNEHFVSHVDKAQGIIYVTLPDGLLDINRS